MVGLLLFCYLLYFMPNDVGTKCVLMFTCILSISSLLFCVEIITILYSLSTEQDSVSYVYII